MNVRNLRNMFPILGVFLLAFSACLEEVPEELEDMQLEIPIPWDLSAISEDGAVTLSWSFDQNYQFSGFVVYRSEDNMLTWHKVGNPSAPPFRNIALRNEIVYWYIVTGLSPQELEGRASIPLPVKTSAYGVIVNNDFEFTNSRNVQLLLTAPQLTQSVIFSEDSMFIGAAWMDFNVNHQFILRSGDGVKVVHAKFKDELGSLTRAVSDSIILDTHAEIDNLWFIPQSSLSPGTTIHFSVTTVGSEKEGSVSIDIENLGEIILARDDGSGGDTQAADGVYEKDYTLPALFHGRGIKVRAIFTDAAGNSSEPTEFPGELDFTDPPDPVYLYPVVDSTTSSITLRWSEAEALNFMRYSIYRDRTVNASDTTSLRVTSIDNLFTIRWTDTGLEEGEIYYYIVYVTNDLDESRGSQVRSASTEDLPPEAVVCAPLSSIGTDRVTLTWSMNANTDFFEYKVYRSTSPGVDESNSLVVTIQDRYQTYFDDSLLDLINNNYYYRVYVFDQAQQKARSNEVTTAP